MELFFKGETHQITLPSGRQVTIREINGADEETLSKIGSVMDQTHISKFVSGILESPKVSVQELSEWLANDVYYILFKQRLINHGPELTFPAGCANEACKAKGEIHEYTEDLDQFDTDLSTTQPAKNELGIKQYPLKDATFVEFAMSSGKQIRFNILSMGGDIKSLDIPVNNRNNNTPLSIRNVEIYHGGRWHNVGNFAMFSAKEMKELRSKLAKSDLTFNPVVEYKCPTCGQLNMLEVLRTTSFFYPTEGNGIL